MNLFVFFLLSLKASLLSTGGMGNIPSLHDDLLRRGWARDRYFTEALAVGQMSPGPNGLWVVSLGYFVGGVPGSLMTLFSIIIPPFFILAVEWLYHRTRRHPAVEGFVHGLGLATLGVFAVLLVNLMRDIGADRFSLILCGAAAGAGLVRRAPVIAILAVAALIGIAAR